MTDQGPVLDSGDSWVEKLGSTSNSDKSAVQNNSGTEIKVNYDNTESGYVGMIVANGSERFYDITDSIIIYAKSQSGTPTVVVEEIS